MASQTYTQWFQWLTHPNEYRYLRGILGTTMLFAVSIVLFFLVDYSTPMTARLCLITGIVFLCISLVTFSMTFCFWNRYTPPELGTDAERSDAMHTDMPPRYHSIDTLSLRYAERSAAMHTDMPPRYHSIDTLSSRYAELPLISLESTVNNSQESRATVANQDRPPVRPPRKRNSPTGSAGPIL